MLNNKLLFCAFLLAGNLGAQVIFGGGGAAGATGPTGPTGASGGLSSAGWNLTLAPVMGVTQYQFGTNNTTMQTSTTNSNGWNLYMIANCNPYAGFSMTHCGNYVSRYAVNGDAMGGTAGGAGYYGDYAIGGTSNPLGSLIVGSSFHFEGLTVGASLTGGQAVPFFNAFDCNMDGALSGTLLHGACFRSGLPGTGITAWSGFTSGNLSPAPYAGLYAYTHSNLADVYGDCLSSLTGVANLVVVGCTSGDKYLHANYNNEGDFPITRTIASGATAMGTSSIASGACSAAVTVSATGVLATDTITFAPNVDPTSVTGYAPSASGSLYIWPYPTAGNVNFKVCNNTGTSQTPSALTLNWKVPR